MKWSIPSLVFLILLAFFPIHRAEFVAYDDPAIVTENPYVKEGFTQQGLVWAFTQQTGTSSTHHKGIANLWHPLTWISHMIDAELFGVSSPRGHLYHSLLLHTLSSLLLLFILYRLGLNTVTAFVVTSLFAIHPLHVESVAWVSERKDVLSGVFFFGTILAYLHQKRKLSCGLFILALLSKPSVVVLPLLLILLDWWQAKLPIRRPSLAEIQKTITDKLIWFIPAALVALITIITQSQGTHDNFNTPILWRLSTMPTQLLFYLQRTIYPVNLSFHYPFPQSNLVIGGSLFLCLICVVLLWRFHSTHKALLFGVLWFLCLWLPVSGIFYVGTSFTADRYTYLAHIGLFLGLAQSFRLSPHLLLGTLPILLFLSNLQTRVWNNSESLFTHGIKAQPLDDVAIQNLATLHEKNGDTKKAITLYKQTLVLNPSAHITWFNLGNCLRDTGDTKKAIEAYEKSIDIHSNYTSALLNLGLLHLSQGPQNHTTAEDLLKRSCDSTDYLAYPPLGAYIHCLATMNQGAKIMETLNKTSPQLKTRLVKEFGIQGLR